MGNTGVGSSFCDEPEDFLFAGGELFQIGGDAAALEQSGDEIGVDDAFALGESVERIAEGGDVVDAVLEQVSDAVGASREEAGGVGDFS